MKCVLRVLGFAAAVCLFTIPLAAAQNRHDGYYYPTPGSKETYKARARVLPGSDRGRRLGFIVGFTKELAEARRRCALPCSQKERTLRS